MLVFTLCPSVFAAGENVCEIGETKFATLDDALDVVKDGETIRLLKPYSRVPLIAKPNAGLPQFIDGRTVFNLQSGG